jgi:hypothetical protein
MAMTIRLQYLVLLFSLVLTGAVSPIVRAADGNPVFTQPELDQMLAPVALYPDGLLSQILMAATYPLEVVQAARWSNANASLKGDEAVRAADSQDWDRSVKSLVAFPQVLQTMDSRLEWTERLGDAFIGQQAQVMDTVQKLRQKAQAAGNLSSNAQQTVTDVDDAIDVAPTNPEVVYVPYYDPSVVYGVWWWPMFPPVFWAPWGGYGWNAGFAWGLGIGIGADFFFGSWDWHHHQVYSRGGRYPGGGQAWLHEPGHRHGVPYRDASMNRQFGRVESTAPSRADFRGHESPMNTRPGGYGGRSSAMPSQRGMNNSYAEPRSHAFENVGHGAAVQGFSARGHASMPGRSAGPSHPSGSRGGSGRPGHH